MRKNGEYDEARDKLLMAFLSVLPWASVSFTSSVSSQ